MKFYSTKTKNIATGIATVLLFFVLSAIYFAPQLAGEKLIQHDVQQYEGMCKDILDNRAATGEDAQWTGRMFGGMPAFLINGGDADYGRKPLGVTCGGDSIRLFNLFDTYHRRRSHHQGVGDGICSANGGGCVVHAAQKYVGGSSPDGSFHLA